MAWTIKKLKDLKTINGLIEDLHEDADRMGDPFLNQSFITELERQRAEILEQIERLESPLHRAIILKRYADGLKWDAVAGKLFISRATAFRLHKQAIKELERYDSN